MILWNPHKKVERLTGLSELLKERQTKRILCLQNRLVFSYNCKFATYGKAGYLALPVPTLSCIISLNNMSKYKC